MKLLSALFLSHLVVFVVVLLFGDADSYETSYPNINNNNSSCSLPYYPVGNYCLMIEREEKGSQDHMTTFCEDLGGILVNIKDANMLYDIFNYIKDNDMADGSYWIGATKDYYQGWLWSSDYSKVRMTPPLWGNRQPDGAYGGSEVCAIIRASDYYYIHDKECSEVYGGICQPKEDAVSEPHAPNQPSEECQAPFKMIGSGCYLVEMLKLYDCYEASIFCRDHNSHLARIDDANIIGDIYDLLQYEEASLWIDGYNAGENKWKWRDLSLVKRGTPFWAVNADGIQAPDDYDYSGSCMALLPDNNYHFHDFTRSKKSGALCQYDL